MTLIRTSSRYVMPQHLSEGDLSGSESSKSKMLLDLDSHSRPDSEASEPHQSKPYAESGDAAFAERYSAFQQESSGQNHEPLFYEPSGSGGAEGEVDHDLESGFGPGALEEVTNVRIHSLTNRFVGASRLENLYGRIRLRENAPLLRWASGVLFLCFMLDCISLVLRRSTAHSSLYIVLCSITCFQLGLFLFRNRVYSHLLIHYYQYATTALGVSAFAYVVLSDTVVICVLFGTSEPLCATPGERVWQIEDSTRVAYGMSLLYGIMPFGFRVNFLNCVLMYLIALVVHLLLRALSFLHYSVDGARAGVFDALLLDTLFLITIMTTLLYGAYMYERNDRIVFVRMRKSQLESDQLQNELQMVREELGWAEDEANTNELKLEIERAKSDLDRMYPGAQIELEGWVIPFDALAIDKRIGEGSCGEVFRGRVRAHSAYGSDPLAAGQSTQHLCGAMSYSMSFQSCATPTHAGLHGDPSFEGAWGAADAANGAQGHGHRREYSVMPNNQVVAIKRIPKHKITRKTVLSLLQETLAMSKCKHPNVLRLVGVVYDPFVCVVFEYMALGSLKDLLDASHPIATPGATPRFPKGGNTTSMDMSAKLQIAMQSMRERDDDVFRDAERKLQRESAIQALQEYTLPGKCVWTHAKTRMCVNVAAGVSYMHSKNIIHRDLKSSNLMVDATQAVKVADLGTARQLSEAFGLQREPSERSHSGQRPRPMSRVGSPLWIAPEVISSEGEYDHKCDVWSFGVILCELMTHRDPYTDAKGHSNFNLLHVVEGTLSPLDFIGDVLDHTPPAIVRLAQDCCDFDPERRCSMKEALFRLLQIVVEQETHKFEADAVAAAGPYIRYSQPSRKRIIGQRAAATSMDGAYSENYADEINGAATGYCYTRPDPCASRDYSVHTLSSSDVAVASLKDRDLEDLVANSDEELHTDEDDDDEDDNVNDVADGDNGDRAALATALEGRGDNGEDEVDDGFQGMAEVSATHVFEGGPKCTSKEEASGNDRNLAGASSGVGTSIADDFPMTLLPEALEHHRGCASPEQAMSDARFRPISMSTFGDSSAAGASMRVGIADGSLGSLNSSDRLDVRIRPSLGSECSRQGDARGARGVHSFGVAQKPSQGDEQGHSRPQSVFPSKPAALPLLDMGSFDAVEVNDVGVDDDDDDADVEGDNVASPSSRGTGAHARSTEAVFQGHLLRQCLSTHNLGETLAQEKVQSLLSTFPSMGSMVSSTFAASRDSSMLERDLSERRRRVRRSGPRSEKMLIQHKQSQSCRAKRRSSGTQGAASRSSLTAKQSKSMRESFQCVVEF